MVKYYCDRCGKELDGKNMDYVGCMIDDYSDQEHECEHWMFCHDCAPYVKRSIVKNIAEYENRGN